MSPQIGHLLSVNKFMSVRKTLATPSVKLRKHGYEKHTYVETRRNAVPILRCMVSLDRRFVRDFMEEFSQQNFEHV